MNVFVTGASGFIGAHLTRALLAKGHEVSSRPGKARECLASPARGAPVDPGHARDLGDAEALRRALSGLPARGLHSPCLACRTRRLHACRGEHPFVERESDPLHEFIRSGCRRIAGAGTCFEYDTAAGCRTRTAPSGPNAKPICGGQAFLLPGGPADRSSGRCSVAWGRIFYPYGPQEDERRLPPAAIRVLTRGTPFLTTAGEQVRDYIYVVDVAEAFCVLLEKGVGGVFNVSSDVRCPFVKWSRPSPTDRSLGSLQSGVGRRIAHGNRP